ncbi:VTT domain-containing protein [Candidatus Pacearchaeota archaeon]|nr:VTT domain-containing protein [Candidatus Pacearchaeota archaeon]
MKLQTYGVLAFFLISLVLEFVPQYISPHIIIFSSPLFNINLFVVLLVTLIGSALGSSLGFAVGRLYGLHFAASLFSTKTLTKIIHAMNEHGRWYVLIAALSPLPFIPLIFGALHFSRRNFFWFGLIPRMLGLCVIAGIVKWFL